jgi:hypothetical protein
MDLDWQKPFQIAAELFLFILGWSIVAIIGLFTVAIFLGFIGALRTVIVKGKKRNDEAVEKAILKSVE